MKNCEFCQEQFNNKRHDSRFCSTYCQNRFYYNRRGGAKYQRNYLYERNGKPKDAIKCEICGKYFKQVGSHVYQVHKMTARDYRKEHGFDLKRGQQTEDLRELRAWQVRLNGTIDNLKKGYKYRFKKGQAGVGKYERSQQTLDRLKDLHKFQKR